MFDEFDLDAIDVDAIEAALGQAIAEENGVDLDKMLGRIRKMLAMAEDSGATPEEREAFNLRAAALMAKYGIKKAMLADAEPAGPKAADRVVVVPDPYGRDKVILLVQVAEALGARCIYKGNNTVHMFGLPSDLERIEILWASLLVQVAREMARIVVPPGINKVTYVKSFLLAYAQTVRQRLEAAERKARQDEQHERFAAGGTGSGVLVVLERRDQLVREAMREVYPKTRRTTVSRSRAGMAAGAEAGQRADLGGSRIGAGGRTAIG